LTRRVDPDRFASMGLRLEVRSLWTAAATVSGARFEFDQTRVVIGRRRGADVILPHAAVSQLHATIETRGTGYAVRDEGSTNGTRVNGQRIAPGRPKPLRSGDRIEVGGFALVVEVGVTAQLTSAEDTRALALRLLREARDEHLPEPTLTVLNGVGAGTRLELPPAPSSVVLGRGDKADLRLDDADASREHAEVARTAAGVMVRDLGAKNGILVDRRRVQGERLLHDRDEITLGATVVLYEDPAAETLEAVAADEDEAVEELPSAPEPEPSPAAEEPEPAPDEAGDEPEPEPTAPPAEVVVEPRRAEGPRTDALIYALAGSVLALSIAALVWLLSSG